MKALAASALLLWAGLAQGEDYVRLGTDADFPPNSFINDAGVLDGMEPDIATEMCPMAWVNCEWVILPFAELETALEDGRIDAIFAGLSATDARRERMLFTTPYLAPGVSAFVARIGEAPAQIGQDTTIAAQAGTTQANHVVALGARLVEARTQDDALALLRSGAADLALAARAWYMTRDRAGLTQFGDPVTLSQGAAIALRLDDTALATTLTRAIETMDDTGRLQTLQEKWLGKKNDT